MNLFSIVWLPEMGRQPAPDDDRRRDSVQRWETLAPSNGSAPSQPIIRASIDLRYCP